MRTSDFAARYKRLPLEWARRTSLEDGAEVSVSLSMNADRNRLFQALTFPEYIDTWFVAPDATPGTTAVTKGANCFVVSYRSLDGSDKRFVGSYKVFRRGKVQFAWRQHAYGETSSSLVRIRLDGNFERTTVHLTHLGIAQEEQSHYSVLWQASLERLASLF